MRGPVEKVGDIVQVVTWCRQIKKWRGNYSSLNGVLALFLEDKMTKDPWLFLEGGWKLRCESLASLRYFLHGLAERVGDIVQVVTWCRQIKKRRGNHPLEGGGGS